MDVEVTQKNFGLVEAFVDTILLPATRNHRLYAITWDKVNNYTLAIQTEMYTIFPSSTTLEDFSVTLMREADVKIEDIDRVQSTVTELFDKLAVGTKYITITWENVTGMYSCLIIQDVSGSSMYKDLTADQLKTVLAMSLDRTDDGNSNITKT